MKKPLVSVIIPTFNRAEYVMGAVESALGQTYGSMQVIVVDHASSDETPKVVEELGSDVLGIRMDDRGRGGVGAPRNEGLVHASGEYVAFLDDDDLWDPEKIQRQVAILSETDNTMVSSDARVIDTLGKTVRDRYLGPRRIGSDPFLALTIENFVIVSSVLARRQEILKYGGFDERPSLYMVEDYHLWLRMAARGGIAFIDEPLMSYRIHGGSHGRASALKALKKRRAVLWTSLQDSEVRRRARVVLAAIARDYARSAITSLRLGL